ncbi:YiiX/YebB-like N1pC/P60 family cysteine hydrolase [Myxococcota bacterium]
MVTRHRSLVWIVPLVWLSSSSCASAHSEWAGQLRDGDLVFQQSRSSQSQAIAAVTGSRYTHVGIVFLEKGRPFVVEAIGPSQWTPWARWVARGVDGHVLVKRLTQADELLTAPIVTEMKRVARGLTSKPYDLRFEWCDDALYCTELVYKIFKRGAGVEIGDLQKVGDLELGYSGVLGTLRQRGIPRNRLVLTPRAMLEDPQLGTVLPR